VDDPHPEPAQRRELEQGSTVTLTIFPHARGDPVRRGLELRPGEVGARQEGLFSPSRPRPTNRDDVDAGTVMSSNPSAYLKAMKSEPVELVIATDPHLELRNVVGLDQGTATAQLQGDGLEVAAQTASSRSQTGRSMLKQSPSSGDTVVRGDTVTLTVSSGPKQVSGPRAEERRPG